MAGLTEPGVAEIVQLAALYKKFTVAVHSLSNAWLESSGEGGIWDIDGWWIEGDVVIVLLWDYHDGPHRHDHLAFPLSEVQVALFKENADV
jgi:hypothetical protein